MSAKEPEIRLQTPDFPQPCGLSLLGNTRNPVEFSIQDLPKMLRRGSLQPKMSVKNRATLFPDGMTLMTQQNYEVCQQREVLAGKCQS